MRKVTSREIDLIQETVLSDLNILTSFVNVIKLEFARYLNLEEDKVKLIFSETHNSIDVVLKEIKTFNNFTFKKNNTSIPAIKYFFNKELELFIEINKILGGLNNYVDKKKLNLFIRNIFEQHKRDFSVNAVKSLEDKVNQKSYIFLSNVFIAGSIIYSIIKTDEEENTLKSISKEDKDIIKDFYKKISTLLNDVEETLNIELKEVKEPLEKKQLIKDCMALSLKLEGKKVNNKNIKEFSSYLDDLNKMSYLKLEEELKWLTETVEEKNNKKRKVGEKPDLWLKQRKEVLGII